MVNPDHPLAELLARDVRYKFEAYLFVFEALKYAHEELGMGATDEDTSEVGAEDDEEHNRHLSGQQLCEAIRQYAHQEYGYLAQEVLRHWGVTRTGDFGEIVFNLIDIKEMRKTPEDRREDFEDVYDFDDAFQRGFQFSSADASEGPRSK
ncbi:Minf_1886 family protein [Adhaeretor mobilis]|uniref:Uncharacterized protein n=1 Tax=Adhaeretor mobilis TaxID=1930276 RepID=A0A517MPH8_9BACT|nr:Minf_1886 family protein [Adhaeretor mobilis]QDS96788.1 hypothetical protein HG15A2_00460 [Adhaeretor mobilis]